MDMHNADHVFRDQRALVERALRRFGVPERDVADATQDVFVVVHRKLPTFEGRSSVTTWIYRIAFHVASQYRRRASHRHEVLGEAEVLCSAGVDHECRDLVERAIASLEALDPDKRDVFVHFELHEEPMAKIAQRLGLPLKTAFSRLYAARRDLMRRMREGGLAALWLPSTPRNHSAWSLTAATGVAATWLLVSLPTMPAPLLLSPTRKIEPAGRAPNYEVVGAASFARAEATPPVARKVARAPSDHKAPSASPTEPQEPLATLTTGSLIVFRDSEAELTPSLPPPLLAELPPAAAREPRIQLRGRHVARLDLTRAD